LTRVIKRKGSIKPFEADKIKGSLQRAALDAGFSLEEKQELLDEVYAKVSKELDKKIDAEGKIKSETIKVCLLSELDKCEPYIARSWRSYEEKKSR
jgi:transcriptional repressor NrdR